MSYLLGDLAEPAAVDLEDRFMADPALFEQLQSVEADLLDQYVSGTLPQADRTRLEARLLPSPEGRQKIAFARALFERATATTKPARPSWRWRPWAAALALAAAALLVLRLGSAPDPLVLRADTVRSAANTAVIEVPVRDMTVSLVVDPAEPAHTFEAQLTHQGVVRHTQSVERAGGEPISLTLPARALQAPGRYRLDLVHSEGTIMYPFQVK